jgi:hypothetical protein
MYRFHYDLPTGEAIKLNVPIYFPPPIVIGCNPIVIWSRAFFPFPPVATAPFNIGLASGRSGDRKLCVGPIEIQLDVLLMAV